MTDTRPDDEPTTTSGLGGSLGISTLLAGGQLAPGQDPLPGMDLGGVTIVRLIGQGGMGCVYEGLQDRPRRAVAVKLMRPGLWSDEARSRFDLELEILGRLRDPNVVHIHTAGSCLVAGQRIPFFVMELLPDARPLTRFAQERTLDIAGRLELFERVCAAVGRAHRAGVVHRDLKPSNILVEPNGAAKLIDFGIARLVDGSPGSADRAVSVEPLVGSMPYMSPEQCDGGLAAVDERTDVYALGVVLYELLANRLPYTVDRRRLAEAVKIIETETPPSLAAVNPDVPVPVAEICRRCLAKAPADRYPDAEALAEAVGKVRAEAWPQTRPPADRRPLMGRRGLLGLAAGAVAVTAVAAAVRRRGSVRLSREIDVLKKIDVTRDTVSGRWWLKPEPDGGATLSSDESTPAKLKLPVEIPDEYDLFVEFSRRAGRQGIAVLGWARGHGFGFDVGAVDNTMVSFQDVDGLHIGQNSTTVRRPAWIVPGKRHTCLVQVRRDRIVGFFDGEQISTLEIDGTNLTYAPTWGIPGGGLGVGSWASPSAFHRIVLRPPGGDEPGASSAPSPAASRSIAALTPSGRGRARRGNT